jgi:hypothetical protein
VYKYCVIHDLLFFLFSFYPTLSLPFDFLLIMFHFSQSIKIVHDHLSHSCKIDKLITNMHQLTFMMDYINLYVTIEKMTILVILNTIILQKRVKNNEIENK